MTPTLKTFVLNKMRAYLCSKMFLCAIENALGLLVSCLKNRPIFYKNIGAYTDGLLLKNIFIGLYIRLSADAWSLWIVTKKMSTYLEFALKIFMFFTWYVFVDITFSLRTSKKTNVQMYFCIINKFGVFEVFIGNY